VLPPPRRPANVAAMLVLGFLAATAFEFAADLLFIYLVHPSQGQADTIWVVRSAVLGGLASGALFLARPREPAVAILTAASAFVAGAVADMLSSVVYFVQHDLPVPAELVTGYLAQRRAAFWLVVAVETVVAAGLALLRVRAVARAAPSPWHPGGPPFAGPYGGPWQGGSLGGAPQVPPEI
jgi:hypothetical protein